MAANANNNEGNPALNANMTREITRGDAAPGPHKASPLGWARALKLIESEVFTFSH
jgi:hypothetical protein